LTNTAGTGFSGPDKGFPFRAGVFPPRAGQPEGASQGQSNCLPAGYWHNRIGATRQPDNAANNRSEKIASKTEAGKQKNEAKKDHEVQSDALGD
jgi:hypothetical protein